MDFKRFTDWISQPSTIKAAMVLAGFIGYKIDPSKLQAIVEAVGVLYIGIQAFYNQQPRKPAEPTPCDPAVLEATLTTAQIAEIVKLRKAKIAAKA